MKDLRIPAIANVIDFAEVAAQMHYSVATSPNTDISHYSGVTYKTTLNILYIAIGTAYPEVNIRRIYDIWVDCNESVAYCVDVYKKEMKELTDILARTAQEDMQDIVDDLTKSDTQVKSDTRVKTFKQDKPHIPGNYHRNWGM